MNINYMIVRKFFLYLKFTVFGTLLLLSESNESYAQTLRLWNDSINNLYTRFKQERSVSYHKAIVYNGQYIPIAMGGFVYQDSIGKMDTVPFLYYYSYIKMSLLDFEQMRQMLDNTTTLSCYCSIPIAVAKDEFEIKRFEYKQEMGQLVETYLAEVEFPYMNSYLLITAINDAYKVSCTDYGGSLNYHIPQKKQARMKKKLDKLHRMHLEQGGARYFNIR